MRYVEEDELVATNQFLLRLNEAGVSDDLLFLPSELNKLGVAPKDVADQIEWLKQHRPGFDQPTTVMAVVRATARVETTNEPQALEVVAVSEESLPEIVVGESEILVLDYDGSEGWDWLKPIDEMINTSVFDSLVEEPGVPSFNRLVVMMKAQSSPESKPQEEEEKTAPPQPQPAPQGVRTRGKMARAARLAATTD
jgi:hypothetical protein